MTNTTTEADLATELGAQIAAFPLDARPWHELGKLYHRRGEFDAAVEAIGRAVSLESTRPEYLNDFGIALQSMGKCPFAIAAFRAALQVQSDYLESLLNLSRALHSLQQFAAAIETCESGLRHHPQSVPLLHQAVQTAKAAGRRNQQMIFLTQAVQITVPAKGSALASAVAEWLRMLAELQMEQGDFVIAVETLQRSLALEPDSAVTFGHLARAESNRGNLVQAQAALSQASTLDPGSRSWKLRAALVCPEVFASQAEIAAYRSNLEHVVEACLPADQPLSRADLFSLGFVPPYGLSYHGVSNRGLKEKFAAACRHAFRRQRSDGPRRTGKIRVGFLVTPGHEGGFLRSHAGILSRLDRHRFSVGLACDTASAGKLASAIGASDLFHVPIDFRFRQNVAAIGDADLDVLYHWEIGSDAMNYFLPLECNTRVQCTSWGSQATSGQLEVDYYLSSELAEGAEAQSEYSERLWRMTTLPTYQQRVPKPPPASREAFGLRNSDKLYLCPQSLLKLHPDQDQIFAEILRRDPLGKIVLLQGVHEFASNQLLRRFQQAIPDVAERIHFLPRQSHSAFLQLLTVADVILDPIHYSAGSSAYDIFSLNLPIVAFWSKFFVGRYTAACYRRMGIDGLVATSTTEYVALANRIANDPEYRQELNQELADRSGRLFCDDGAVSEHERFFEHAAQGT